MLVCMQAKDDPLFYVHNEVGYNYRMTNVQAAIGVAQMELLEEFIKRKNKNYDDYTSKLADFNNGELVQFREGTYSNKGLQTRTIWGLIHQQKPYVDCIAYKIEKAEYYSSHIINLPCSTNLKVDDIEIVCEKIKAILSV